MALPTVDTVFTNARVLTLEPRRPTADLLGIRGGRVALVGEREDLGGALAPGVRAVDCQGGVLLPAFHDAHLHLLALASRLLAVDAAPPAVRSLRDLKDAIARRTRETPPGGWVRAWGYREGALAEGRHPTRHDLDEAAPHHPVRLVHGSGHASVLNSPALASVGIGRETPDPPEGVIERDRHGEPTGLFLELDDWLDKRIPPLPEETLVQGLKKAVRLLLSQGVAGVQDATAANDLERWRLFRRLRERGALPLRAVFFPGLLGLHPFRERGMRFGQGDEGLRLGHAKLLLTMTTGALYPPQEEVVERVQEAAASGWPVALHAVEAEAVEAAAEAIAGARPRGPFLPHRIEHASECPDALLPKITGSGAWAVTNPAFLYHSGDRYRKDVPPERQGWLYRIGSFQKAGVPVAFGSDAPVELPAPFLGLYGATTRRSAGEEALLPQEAVPIGDALRMHTLEAAKAGGWRDLGLLREGFKADLVLLDKDPTQAEPEALQEIKVWMTVVGGKTVWQA